VCWPESVFHEVQDVATTANEEEFHSKVVEGHPVTIEEVKIAGNEHSDIESLSFERNASA